MQANSEVLKDRTVARSEFWLSLNVNRRPKGAIEGLPICRGAIPGPRFLWVLNAGLLGELIYRCCHRPGIRHHPESAR